MLVIWKFGCFNGFFGGGSDAPISTSIFTEIIPIPINESLVFNKL